MPANISTYLIVLCKYYRLKLFLQLHLYFFTLQKCGIIKVSGFYCSFSLFFSAYSLGDTP